MGKLRLSWNFNILFYLELISPNCSETVIYFTAYSKFGPRPQKAGEQEDVYFKVKINLNFPDDSSGELMMKDSGSISRSFQTFITNAGGYYELRELGSHDNGFHSYLTY